MGDRLPLVPPMQLREDHRASLRLSRPNRETAYHRTVLQQLLPLRARENAEVPDTLENRDDDVVVEEIRAQNSA